MSTSLGTEPDTTVETRRIENSRNGHSRKTMKAGTEEVEIAVPRDLLSVLFLDLNAIFQDKATVKRMLSISGKLFSLYDSIHVKSLPDGHGHIVAVLKL